MAIHLHYRAPARIDRCFPENPASWDTERRRGEEPLLISQIVFKRRTKHIEAPMKTVNKDTFFFTLEILQRITVPFAG